MKKFQFDEIQLMSSKEQRGRKVMFHPKRNLIIGGNHRGKSTLIKSLFSTLGATPTAKLDRWDTHAVCAVKFTVDSTQYQIINDRGRRGIFDEKGFLLASSAQGAEWAKLFAEIVGFNLTLTNKKTNEPTLATPACFFLPFYIDQDTGWVAEWGTFNATREFIAPIKPILEYFSGLEPPEYYRAKSRFDEIKLKLASINKEIDFITSTQKRFGNRLSQYNFKVDSKNFELEIKKLTEELTQLNIEQEKLRQKAVQEEDLILLLDRQINAANSALKEYESDTNYLLNLKNEPLICPVCHAEHSEPYLDLLAFADDARSLQSLSMNFVDEKNEYIKKLNNTNKKIASLESRYKQIETILNTRRGEITLKTVIESYGAEKAFEAFELERKPLEDERTKLIKEQEHYDLEIKKWSDKERRSNILNAFKVAYDTALFDLNMPPAKINQVNSRPKLSGSGGPRAILAYHSALWSICLSSSGSFNSPIVVDSPNQQGQDKENLPKVLEYVSTKLPSQGQVIIGSELDVTHEFDQRIELNNQRYQLLSEAEFISVSNELNRLLDTLYHHNHK